MPVIRNAVVVIGSPEVDVPADFSVEISYRAAEITFFGMLAGKVALSPIHSEGYFAVWKKNEKVKSKYNAIF